MARFTAEFLEDLRQRVPVSEVVGKKVSLRKAGRELRGLSPFNKEKTPSFFVNDGKAAWFDFSSGKNGNVFDFLMQTEGMTFPEAVERIASMAGVPLPNVTPDDVKREERRRSLREVIEMSAKFFEAQLHADGGKAARDYLSSRMVNAAGMAKRFRIGWAPDERFALKEHLGAAGILPETMIEAGLLVHGDDVPVPYDKFRGRVIFPITDARGNVVGFGGRGMGDQQPKYLNSPETPLFHKGSLLYNAHAARLPAFKGEQPLVVVEGYTDVVSMVGVGFEATVASLGTAFTVEQLSGLWRMADEPILCFDGDDAGARAMSKAIDTALPLLAPGRSLRFAVLPPGQDPDDLARTGGREAVDRVLKAARPLVDALWTREAAVASALTTPEKRAVFEGRIKQVVTSINDEAVRRHYADDLFGRVKTLLAAPKGAVGGPPVRKHRAEYDYDDQAGRLLYQVVTYDPEGMSFRRPVADEDGVWVWGLAAGEYMRKGDGHDWYRHDEQRYVEWGCQERRTFPAVSAVVPYGLPAVTEAVADERMVWITRSEDLADALSDRGLVATTVAGGVRGVPALAKLERVDAIILVEHDDAGRQFAHAVSMKLRGVAGRIRVLDISQFWTACPQHGGLVDWWDAGGTEDGLYAIVEQIPDWKPTPPQSQFGAIRHIDIDLPAREHAWLIKGVLTQGELSILAGARSSGKSFLALDEAYGVARAAEEQGLTWFGRRVHGGLVLYQAGEGKLGLRKRMRAYRDYNQIAKDRDVPLVLLPKEMNLHLNDDHTNKIIAEGKAWSAFYGLPVVLLVIDTFAKATTGANENASEDMSRVLDRGARISDALGCHVQFVHHLNAGGTKVRGHSSLMGNVENAIEIETTDAKEFEVVEGGREIIRAVREARITKQKDDESGGHWNFVLKQVIVGRDSEGDPITSCVISPTNEAALPAISNATKDNIGVMLNPGRVIFFRDGVLRALDEHGIPPPSGLRLPRSVERVVEWDLVKIAYRKAGWPDDTKAKANKDMLKTYVKRHREFFQAANIMGFDKITSKEGETEVETSYAWLTGKPVFGKSFAWPARKKPVVPDAAPILDPVSGERMDADLPF